MIQTMPGDLQPLDQKFPIVTPDGRPTLYFIKWAQQKQIDITSSITATQALAIIEQYLADHQLQEGSGISISPSGNLSDAPTIAAEVQAILDQITTTRGSILFRGAADWQALAPGTAGQVLKSNGAGADPSWGAGGGGGGGIFSAPYLTQGGILTSAFATHGNVFTALKDFTIEGFNVRQQISSGNTYRVFVATVATLTLDAASENLTATGTTFGTEISSQAFTSPTTGQQFLNITLSSPVSISAGGNYTIGIQRTDSTGTAVAQTAWHAQQMPSMLCVPAIFYRRLWHSNVSPGVGSLNGVTTTSIDTTTATGLWILPWGSA